ncbi:MAG TPA: Ldh family oxidoreductase [Chloroflexota bacterium]|nr:Ldh family oxidoreductase [Chloroflexota bacterium]
MPEVARRVDHLALRGFVSAIFEKLNVPSADAATAADVLVHADLLGIDSHGVARLAGHPGYVPGLRNGYIKPAARPRIVHETAATALLDGDGGLGSVVSTRGMELAIAKAKEAGVGAVTVTNSHHFGIASHYALLALEHEMIGVSMTNAAPQVVATYGKRSLLGTNPISVAVPTDRERPFILDMATSVGAAGKVEIARRTGKPMPDGWLVDAEGHPTRDPEVLWKGGSLLPLGSTPELASYKGYGLANVVDVLCGVLSGAGYSSILDEVSWATGHFFLALKIEAFRPLAAFLPMMDAMIATLRSAEPAPGAERVYVHGERELDAEVDRRANGIPLHPVVEESLRSLASDFDLRFPE